MNKENFNKIIANKEDIKKQMNLLPKRFHEEFIEDVIVDEVSIECFRKVYTYYINEIWNELTENEREMYREHYLFIEL